MANEDVVFKVGVDDSSVEKDMNNVKKKVTNIANETADAQKKAQDSVSDNAVSNNDKTVDSTERSVKRVKKTVDDTAEARRKAQDDTARNAEENDKKIVDSAEKTHKSVTETASREGDKLVRKHAEDTEQLKKHQSDYEEKAKKTAENVKKFYLAAGAAIVAETTAAITAAANYQSSYAKVFTLTGDDTNRTAYAKSIRQAAKNTGVNVGDMSESVYSAISASVDQDKAVGFTENAVKLAKGGFTETAAAVDVLTTAINAYGLAADDATHISDVLITTQNLGKTTVDELAHSMGQTIPIANSAGVAIEELSTMYAVMTKNGVATAESGTQIKAMLNELNASGTNIDKTLRELAGKSFSELKDEGKTTADVLNMLNGHAESSGKQLSDLFGSVEAGAAALTLVKDGGKDFSSILDQMQNSAGAAEKAYETMSNTIEAKADKLLNKITIMFAEAGEEMLPLVDDLISYIDENADEIEDIIKGTGEAMKDVILIAGDVLKILWDHKEAVAAVTAAFIAYKTTIAISSVIDKFRVATEGATIAQNLLNVAMSANPAGLVAAGVAALTVGLVSYFSSMDSGAKALGELSDSVKTFADNAKNAADEQTRLEDVAAEYDHINEAVTDAKEKKEKLAQLQERLNSLYGSEKNGIDLVNGSYEEQLGLLTELTDKERAHRINLLEEEVAAAKKAVSNAEGYQLPLTFKLSDNTEDFINGKLNDIYTAWQKKSEGLFTFGTGRDDERNLYIEGNIDEQIKLLEELEQAIQDSGESTGELKGAFEAVGERLTVLKDLTNNASECETALDALKNTTDGVSESISDAVLSTDDFSSAITDAENCVDELKKANSDLDESAETLINRYSGLYDALKTLENGGALNYNQMQDLIDLYPELADKIKVAADGYVIETDALGDLRIALDDSVNATVEAEKAKTQATIQGTKDRLKAMYEEMEVLAKNGEYSKANEIKKQADIARKELTDLETNLKSYVTLPDYIKSGKGSSSGSSASSSAASGSGTKSSAKTSGKNGDPDNESKFDKLYDDLKYRHSTGMSDKLYYNRLDTLKNSYLEKGSAKWRTIDAEVYKGRVSLKKADDSAKEKREAEKKAAAEAAKKESEKERAEAYESALEELDEEFDNGSGSMSYAEYYERRGSLVTEHLNEDDDKYRTETKAVEQGMKSAEKKDISRNASKFGSEVTSKKLDVGLGYMTQDDYNSWYAGAIDEYLAEGSDEWKRAKLELADLLDPDKKTTASGKSSSSGKSSGTILNINSYIPSVWDTEEEKNAKLKKAVGLELAGGDMYRNDIASVVGDAATVGSTISSTAPAASSGETATLADVVSAIRDIQTADENKKISFEVVLKARDLTIGKAAIDDINDITKTSGKTPLIIK